MKKIVLVVLASLFAVCLFARQVSEQDAKQVALRFFSERAGRDLSTADFLFHTSGSFVVMDGDQPVYFIFNINDQGYVIVSAEDAVLPVLAYSFETIYREKEQAPQFTAWMEQYARQIRFARKSNALPSASATAAWNHLLCPGKYTSLMTRSRDVSPLITSNWDQPFPYNEMCPADPAGSNGHAIVGCVPVCMGQIMYYYRWPDHGTGSYTYYDSTYGTQHASFDSTWYSWNNMKSTISSSDPGIARLLYHLGVSVDLRYGPASSGMYNHKAAYALRTYFKYSPETRYVYRDSTILDWDSLILAHLNRRMPLYYAGWSVPNIMGHAFVCDGYQDPGYFHFNFGWSGSNNGYYYLDNLTPGGNNFNLAQELIINIYPDTLHYEYPTGCSGNTTLRYNQGSLTDGSGPTQNYQQGGCNWLIDPQTSTDSVSRINLSFEQFETGQEDRVTVYNGADTTAPVLGSFSGNTLPSPVSSSGNKMLITFRSWGNTPAPGWTANYSTTVPVWCSGQKTITADSADITDGSLRFNYHNNSLCRWMITPANQKKPLTVYFKSFNTEPGKDLLKILDPETHDTLAIISGDSLSGIPDSVSSPSGKMFLIFSTNSSVTDEGFHLYYPKSTLGNAEHSFPDDIKIFPNPAHDEIFLQIYAAKVNRLSAELLTLDGKVTLSTMFQVNRGTNKQPIRVSGLNPGVYLLRIKGDEGLISRKIVII